MTSKVTWIRYTKEKSQIFRNIYNPLLFVGFCLKSKNFCCNYREKILSMCVLLGMFSNSVCTMEFDIAFTVETIHLPKLSLRLVRLLLCIYNVLCLVLKSHEVTIACTIIDLLLIWLLLKHCNRNRMKTTVTFYVTILLDGLSSCKNPSFIFFFWNSVIHYLYNVFLCFSKY